MDDGPVAAAVAGRLAADLRRAGIGVADPDIRLERLTSSRLGEYRLDVSTFAPGGAGARRWPATVADAAARLPWIARATAVPPRVYLRLETSVLHGYVVEHVLQRERTYGCGDEGRGSGVLVCYCSPNANKPLHIGHLRVNVLGMSVSRLLESRGFDVMRTEMLSNYGIHVCQALAAYLLWGDDETPQAVGKKGDHFVGEHYVLFHSENAKQRALLDLEVPADDFDDVVPATELERAAADLLQRMEGGDRELLALNERFTRWAIDGIRESYRRIGSRHELVLLELDTLPLAKEIIRDGAAAGRCGVRDDGSLYVDVPDLGEFTILRRDGTPLVYTQLLGIWVRRRQLAPSHPVMHITGRQWEAGVTALLELLRAMGHEREADETEAVYYGMVRVPEGKIRSRHGTILALDGVLDRFRERLLATWTAEMRGLPMPGYRREVAEALALALVKLWMLRVRRGRDIVFSEEKVWSEGLFRLRRLVVALRVAERGALGGRSEPGPRASGSERVRDLLVATDIFPSVVGRAAARREPAEVARFLDDYAQRVLICERVLPAGEPLWRCARAVLRSALALLNVELPASLVYLPDPFAAAAPSSRPPDPSGSAEVDGRMRAAARTSERRAREEAPLARDAVELADPAVVEADI